MTPTLPLRRIRTALLVGSLCLGLPANSEPVNHVDRTRVDAALKQFIDSHALVGVSALVYEHGHEAYFGAFGLADREANKPMRRDTLAQIFSMTKPITGVALMTLYEQGKFELDDPVGKYLPELSNMQVWDGTSDAQHLRLVPANRPVTIRDLGRYTTGLPSMQETNPVVDLYKKADVGNIDDTLAQLVQKLGKLPLEYQPGAKWRYGAQVDVEARLIERLSGQPFDVYVRKHVIEPLHMKDTGYFVREKNRKRMAALYEWHEDGSLTRQPDDDAFNFNTKNWPLKPGSWGLVSTLDDYMRFTRMLLNGGELDGARVLKPETVKLMATNVLPKEVTDTDWLPSKGQVGFGINFAVRIASPKGPDEASGAVGEFFWDGLNDTLFWVDPKNEITAVLFTQYHPFGKVPLHKAFRDAIYAGDPAADSMLQNGK
jgi:CubicO group peptidase (beta-lactamase class C family)